jgi:hypothetical protein
MLLSRGITPFSLPSTRAGFSERSRPDSPTNVVSPTKRVFSAFKDLQPGEELPRLILLEGSSSRRELLSGSLAYLGGLVQNPVNLDRLPGRHLAAEMLDILDSTPPTL